MQIREIRGLVAVCEAKGVEREVKLLFLQGEDLRPGDFLVVERGNALQKISAAEAAAAWAVYDEMVELACAEGPGNGGA